MRRPITKANERSLPGVQPNVGTRLRYAARLKKLIDEMANSVEYWLKAQYRAKPPALAQDASSAKELQAALRKLSRRWQRQFNALAPKLAAYYAQAADDRVTSTLKTELAKHGISVKFKMTPAAQDVMSASIAEQVGLIKSIPSQYFTQIEGAVMRSVSSGRDLQHLTKALLKIEGVTKRRASFIALDQNNKATERMHDARRLDLGLTEAVWQHSAAGKEPRPKHVAFSGKRYDIRKGAPIGDKGQFVHPGEEPRCRCVSRTVIPGFM